MLYVKYCYFSAKFHYVRQYFESFIFAITTFGILLKFHEIGSTTCQRDFETTLVIEWLIYYEITNNLRNFFLLYLSQFTSSVEILAGSRSANNKCGYTRIVWTHHYYYYLYLGNRSLAAGRVNLKYGLPEDGRTTTCTAGAGSLLLEFILLSRLTGIGKFVSNLSTLKSKAKYLLALYVPFFIDALSSFVVRVRNINL